jgi:hypothetical protein
VGWINMGTFLLFVGDDAWRMGRAPRSRPCEISWSRSPLISVMGAARQKRQTSANATAPSLARGRHCRGDDRPALASLQIALGVVTVLAYALAFQTESGNGEAGVSAALK